MTERFLNPNFLRSWGFLAFGKDSRLTSPSMKWQRHFDRLSASQLHWGYRVFRHHSLRYAVAALTPFAQLGRVMSDSRYFQRFPRRLLTSVRAEFQLGTSENSSRGLSVGMVDMTAFLTNTLLSISISLADISEGKVRSR